MRTVRLVAEAIDGFEYLAAVGIIPRNDESVVREIQCRLFDTFELINSVLNQPGTGGTTDRR